MKRSRWSFGLAAAIAIVMAWRPGAAIAGNTVLEASLLNGSPAPSNTMVQFRDSTGKVGSCMPTKVGFFSCKTTGFTAPFLTNAGQLYGYAESASGTWIVNGLTDLGTTQIYQSWGTSPGAEWTRMPTPWTISPPVLNSANAWMNETFQYAFNDFNIKPSLTYNLFNTQYKSNRGLGLLLPLLTYGGTGTATETVGASLPNGVTFSATDNAMVSVSGSISHWTVGAGLETTYQSAYANFPTSANLPPIVAGVSKLLGRELATYHHEGGLLDSFNLFNFYSQTNYLENGDDLTNHVNRLATWLRQVNVKSQVIGSINSFQENKPTTGSDLVSINVLRTVVTHGIPCVDSCCVTYICGSDGSNCLEYGNQRIGSFMLRAKSLADYTSPTPVISQMLFAGGIAPMMTLSGYRIDDTGSLYNNDTIPFVKTVNIFEKPLHNLKGFDVQYDAFYLKKAFTPPVPSNDRFPVEIDPVSGPAQTFTDYPPRSTTETLQILSPTSFNTSDFFGKTMTFKISTPKTFLVSGLFAEGVECAGSSNKMLSSIPIGLRPNATTFKFKTDLQIDKNMVTGASYRVLQRAFGGPEISAQYHVGLACSF